jgi:hypothetical protein
MWSRITGRANHISLRDSIGEGLRVTSFGLVLMHKPAYEFRWKKTVVGRSS